MENSLDNAFLKDFHFPILRYILMGSIFLYALLEFYPVNYAANTIAFFAVLAISLVWIGIFPTVPIFRSRIAEPVYFLLLWLSYSLISYIWAADRSLALDFSLLIFRYLVVFMLFSTIFEKPKYLAKAHLMLVGMFTLYILTAIWEMLTFQHLPSSKYYTVPLYYTPTGPFYNQNNLAGFLLQLMPFVLFLPKMYPSKGIKAFSAFMILAFMLIVTVQGARIAMLAAGAVLILTAILYTSRKTIFISLIAMLLLAGAIVHFFPVPVKIATGILNKEISSFGEEAESVQMSSLKIRKQLFIETFDLTANSWFLGLGGGNFEHYMDTDREYRTAGIVNAHNWFLEIVGNFGIVILIGFVYIYLRWGYLLWRRYRSSTGKDRWLLLSYFLSLVMFFATSALPSSIRWNHHVWIIFAITNAIVSHSNNILEEPICPALIN